MEIFLGTELCGGTTSVEGTEVEELGEMALVPESSISGKSFALIFSTAFPSVKESTAFKSPTSETRRYHKPNKIDLMHQKYFLLKKTNEKEKRWTHNSTL